MWLTPYKHKIKQRPKSGDWLVQIFTGSLLAMGRYLLYKGERTVKVSLLSVDIPFLPDCPLSFGLGGFLLAHLTLTAIIYHAVTSNALLMSMHIDCF